MIILINQTDKMITSTLLGYDELVLVIQVLYALISRLMQHDGNHIDQIDDYIKLFLSVCHFYEKKLDLKRTLIHFGTEKATLYLSLTF